jgi:hypothetical protein
MVDRCAAFEAGELKLVGLRFILVAGRHLYKKYSSL